MTESREMVPATQPQEQERYVKDLLVSGLLAQEGVGTVVEAGLAAYALDRSGEEGSAVDSHDKALLRSARLLAGVRHAGIKRATSALVRAWHGAGIDTLLFKGFYLAEYVYPEPSWRAYSDVDVAVRSRSGQHPQELAAMAAEIAAANGFDVVWHLGETPSVHSFHDARYNGHELVQLAHSAAGFSVDAHRRLVHSNVSLRRQSGKGETLTRKVWEAAQRAELGGVPIYVPAAVDSALIGLIAARSWSGDRHVLRPHDFLDLEALMRLGGFGRDELLGRAADLGLTATTKLFLRRCDPLAGTLDLTAPSPARVFLYDTLLLGERGHRGLAQASAALLAAPAKTLAVLRELPAVSQQRARLAAGAGPVWSVADTAQVKPLDREVWRSTQRGVRRAMRLQALAPERHGELALACLHGSLARRGYPLDRVEGAGRVWLEYQGRPLPLDLLGVGGRGGVISSGGYAVGRRSPSPRPSARQRLAAVGWSGAWMRLEALFLLRRVKAGLDARTFSAVRESLLGSGSLGSGTSRSVAGASRPPVAGRHTAAQPDDAQGRAVGRAVESAARFVPGALCVAQSLAGQVMLARRRQPSTIHFGFLRSPSGAVEGHAWLEVDGSVVVGDGPLDSFTRTATFQT